MVDHARKDQVTAGVDVQLSRNWVFKGSVVAHETDGIPFGNFQYAADGNSQERVIRQWPGSFRDYQGITLELNRRFRGGWMLRSNLKVGEGDGNVAVANSASSLFAALGGGEVCDEDDAWIEECRPFQGSTDASSRFRTGRLFNDIDRLNILGMKRFQFGGKQALTLGGFLAITSGRYWGLTRSTSVEHPDTGFEIDFATRYEERDGNQLPDHYTLNLSAMYSFPIKGPVEGELGFEASNITEQDEVLLVNSLEGVSAASSVNSWQQPREFRLKVGIRF